MLILWASNIAYKILCMVYIRDNTLVVLHERRRDIVVKDAWVEHNPPSILWDETRVID